MIKERRQKGKKLNVQNFYFSTYTNVPGPVMIGGPTYSYP